MNFFITEGGILMFSSALSQEQAAKALEMTQALLVRVLPSDAEASTQKIVETVKETMQDPRGQVSTYASAQRCP